MVKNIVRQILVVAVVAWLGIGVVGCGKSVSGKYVSTNGQISIVFDHGKATVEGLTGGSDSDDYTMDGDKITIKTGAGLGSVVLTQNSDGSLDGMGMKFTKAD